jgi:hypothetical protein
MGAPPFRVTARDDLAIVEPDLDTEPAELAQVDADPGSMLRVKATDDPRPVDRPDAMEDQLACVTPQFFLRNTHRTERYGDPDWLEYQVLTYDDRSWREALQPRSRAPRRALGDMPDLASHCLAMEVAEKSLLMVETRWHEHFGRPDPGERLDRRT